MRTKIILGVLGIMLMSVSCKKYENGPELTLRSKKERVANNWQVAKVTQAGSDVTDQYQDYQYYFTVSGTATLRTISRTFTGGAHEEFAYGTWIFMNDKNQIYVNLSDDNKDVTYKITKLYEDEMWLINESTGTEFHFIPL